jgi:hypothetical protein
MTDKLSVVVCCLQQAHRLSRLHWLFLDRESRAPARAQLLA